MPDFETRAADWLPPGTALERILRGVAPLPPDVVELPAARGRVLAEDVRSEVTLPPWANASMDGFAVRSEDVRGASSETPVRLRVTGSVHPGEEVEVTLGSDEAVRIMTGAPVPPGADSVIRVEDTDAGADAEGWVVITSDRDVERNIRPAGSDVRQGDRVLEKGRLVGPAAVGVLAAVGRARVPIHRAPAVAILSTGDELVTLDRFEEVRAGRSIVDANGYALASAIREAGGSPISLGIAPDDEDRIAGALEGVGSADVLVTTGGASMGERDHLKDVLETLGFQLDFWRIRIRPGSPVGFGYLPRQREGPPLPVFSLPGNPVSALVTFELFARPVLRRMAGHRRIHRPAATARAGERLEGDGRLTYFLRVRYEDGENGGSADPGAGNDTPPRVRLTGAQGSHVLSALGRADGLAIIPEGTEVIEEGEEVRVIALDGRLGDRSTPAF